MHWEPNISSVFGIGMSYLTPLSSIELNLKDPEEERMSGETVSSMSMKKLPKY